MERGGGMEGGEAVEETAQGRVNRERKWKTEERGNEAYDSHTCVITSHTGQASMNDTYKVPPYINSI